VEQTPNGVEVRGLRVLCTAVDGPQPWWKWVISLWFASPADGAWHVVTVQDGPSSVVARRRFEQASQARDARERFVRAVTAMSRDAYERADWQAVLDGV
jgi:hypothetical protein